MRIPLRPSSGDFGVGLPPSVRQLILLYLDRDWRRSVTASTLVIFPRRPSLTSELNRLESSKRAFSASTNSLTTLESRLSDAVLNTEAGCSRNQIILASPPSAPMIASPTKTSTFVDTFRTTGRIFGWNRGNGPDTFA